jgi:hypothetical protein
MVERMVSRGWKSFCGRGRDRFGDWIHYDYGGRDHGYLSENESGRDRVNDHDRVCGSGHGHAHGGRGQRL